jgi:aspartate kinase
MAGVEAGGKKVSKMTQKIQIGGVMHNDDVSLVGVMSIPDRPGVAGAILSALGEQEINVLFIVQCIDPNGQDHVVFCVSRDDLQRSLGVLEGVKEDVRAEKIISDEKVGLISIFGPDFRQRPGIAGAMFDALASVGVNILAISSSISTISCIIQAERIPDAMRVLRETFTMP